MQKGLNYLLEKYSVASDASLCCGGKCVKISGECIPTLPWESERRFIELRGLVMNGRLGNMNVDEALKTAKTIGAPVNVPNHYDMFESNSEDPHLFADKIQGGVILDFNTSYELSKLEGSPVFKKL